MEPQSSHSSFTSADREPAILSIARGFSDEIARRADEFEAERRMPADLARRLAEAGLFRLVVPKVYGGIEAHPSEYVRVLEQVSRADGSAGWCVMIAAATAALAGVLPERVARQIYASNPRVITGGATAPTGTAVADNGGWRINGRWQWGSGTQNCDWITAGVIVHEGGKPRMLPSGDPEIRLAILKASQVKILDTWYASGLRGTGSHDFEVRNQLVADEFAPQMGAMQRVVDRPICLFPFWGLLAMGVCSVALGIARRAIDEFVALACAKTPAWERRKVAETSRAQSQVALAEAALRSARAFLFATIDAAWEIATTGNPPTVEARRDLRLAAANAAWQSAHAVDLMYNAGGGTSVFASSALQRCFRDVHVVTQHRMVNEAMFEHTGKLYLGIGAAPFFL